MFVPAGMMFFPGGPQPAQPPQAKYFSIDVECVATGTGALAAPRAAAAALHQGVGAEGGACEQHL